MPNKRADESSEKTCSMVYESTEKPIDEALKAEAGQLRTRSTQIELLVNACVR